MQAKIKSSSRYGTASLFSGREFVKFEWRQVPPEFEGQARGHELLEIREGKAEKEVVAKQAAAKVKPLMKARLVADYKDPSLRTFGMNEYFKDTWTEVPEGYEESARRHELLEVWEAGQDEPSKAPAKKVYSSRKKKIDNDDPEE